MGSRSDEAQARHDRGFNCAQAVACSFADLVGADEAVVFSAAEGFGLGMGGMDGTCGALSGACLVAGLALSCGDLGNPTSKRATYARCAAMTERFRELSGATRCRELKGVDTGRPLCSCARCIENGVRVVEETLLPPAPLG